MKDISTNLIFSEGIWKSKTNSTISYPSDGNANFFKIEENSFWFTHRNKCIANVVRNFQPCGDIFDVGGGNGFVSMGLNQAGFSTYLLEPGIDGIINGKKRGVTKLIHSTFEDVGFENNSIPAIGLFDVLEHIEDDKNFLQQLNKNLIKDGMLYITVPAFNHLWSSEDVHAGHYRRYTLQTLNNVLSKSGFKTLYETYFFSMLPMPIFLLRSLPSKFGFDSEQGTSDKHASEHSQRKGLMGATLQKILNWESKSIANKRRLKVGSSCLVAAKKIE